MKKVIYYLTVVLFSSVLLFNDVVYANDKYEVEIERNIKYGEGFILKDGQPTSVDLLMNIYKPITSDHKQRPAVFFTYGGAFQRGTPHERYEIDGQQDTSPEEYCKRLAQEGYVCFAINYRVTPDLPIPHLKGINESTLLNRDGIKLMMDRASQVRADMNLPPLDPKNPSHIKIQSDAVLAAAEDLQSAVQYVKQNAEELSVDKNKIIIGGFSAGAVTSWNVAYGLKEPVTAVFLLSGAPIVFELDNIKAGENHPPILQFLAQTDLTGARIANPLMIEHYQKTGVEYEFAWVPGFGHFYPAGATSMSGDARRIPVETRLLNFIKRVVEPTI
ncbi:alpha/beta hydrolase [Flammeovirga agarivorans]|uniref:Alpha/beta hydrolase n=1 Tax=Flammeovirga agarivorans TaxID=2726742 RepID=A0A7X8XX60_9BACT|nr:alpha/beta hydrolase fold domain-containing protein [Flammeovirga agarivorans]NLR92942.1 alpha/beta hydrolase [Flammeovirga agarivorans]